MVAQGCSDLHMSSQERPMFRLHGSMSPVEGTVPIKPEEMITVLREKLGRAGDLIETVRGVGYRFAE